MPTVRPSVVLLVAAALLTGCAGGEDAAAHPTGSPSAPTRTAVPSPPTGGVDVDREHLDVADVNACALLTETERRYLGLADQPRPKPLVGDPAGMECRFVSADGDSLGFYSIAVWPSRNGASFGDELGPEQRYGLVVAGYPATGYHAGEDSPEVCAIGVSVGRNQAIAVARFATGPLLTAERTCDEAHGAAERAVHALLDPARQDELRGERPGDLTVSLGDRPADLDLTDVDSCALVDEGTRESLRITNAHHAVVRAGSRCDQPGSWSNLEVHYTLLAVRRNAAALAEHADPEDVQRLSLSGYPAVWVAGDTTQGCVLAVEVDDGQALVVEHEVYLDEDSLLVPPCEAAALMATSALRTLAADQGLPLPDGPRG